MKIRLVEEYDPVENRTTFHIERWERMFPVGLWRFVTCSTDRDRAMALWETAKIKGVVHTKKVIAEAVIP